MIPLGNYDIILGMDWLEFYSPMKVDWVKKYLEFEYNNVVIKLQGITPGNPTAVQYDSTSVLEGCLGASL